MRVKNNYERMLYLLYCINYSGCYSPSDSTYEVIINDKEKE